MVPVEYDVAELQCLGKVLPHLVGGNGPHYPLLVQPQNHFLGLYLLREQGVRVDLQLLKTLGVGVEEQHKFEEYLFPDVGD